MFILSNPFSLYSTLLYVYFYSIALLNPLLNLNPYTVLLDTTAIFLQSKLMSKPISLYINDSLPHDSPH